MLSNFIAECDRVYPNTVACEAKEKWLSRLEAIMREELSEHLPLDTEVVGAFPYDEIYVEYLKMKCAEAMGDIARFNNYLTLFNSAKDALYAHYVRTYKSAKKAGWKNVL